jgi:type IV secretory pathway TrbL component
MNWMTIFSAAFIILMLIFIIPRVKPMLQNSPKASSDDWIAAIIPLLLVMGFVFLLIKAV